MQRMKYQIEQYELVIPIYKAQLEEALHVSARLGRENQEHALDLAQVKSRLVHAESLILKGIGTQEAPKQQTPAVPASENEQSVQQEGPQGEQSATSVISVVDSSPEQNVDRNMGAEAEDKPATPPPRVISLTTRLPLANRRN